MPRRSRKIVKRAGRAGGQGLKSEIASRAIGEFYRSVVSGRPPTQMADDRLPGITRGHQAARILPFSALLAEAGSCLHPLNDKPRRPELLLLALVGKERMIPAQLRQRRIFVRE